MYFASNNLYNRTQRRRRKMNSFEKTLQSPFHQFMNLLYKLIVINLLYLFTTALGFVFFTFAPATIATMVCMKGIYEKKDFPIVASFISIVKSEYKKSMILWVFYVITFAILGGSFYYYSQSPDSLFNTIGLVISGLALMLHFTSFLHMLLISVYTPDVRFRSKLKYSYMMIVYKPGVSLLLVVVNVLVVIFSYVFITFSFLFTFAFLWYYNIAISHRVYQSIRNDHESLDVLSR